jgi:hypothetical protein
MYGINPGGYESHGNLDESSRWNAQKIRRRRCIPKPRVAAQRRTLGRRQKQSGYTEGVTRGMTQRFSMYGLWHDGFYHSRAAPFNTFGVTHRISP